MGCSESQARWKPHCNSHWGRKILHVWGPMSHHPMFDHRFPNDICPKYGVSISIFSQLSSAGRLGQQTLVHSLHPGGVLHRRWFHQLLQPAESLLWLCRGLQTCDPWAPSDRKWKHIVYNRVCACVSIFIYIQHHIAYIKSYKHMYVHSYRSYRIRL